MRLTGNPFVDAGFGIAAKRAGRESVAKVSRDDLAESVRAINRTVAKLREFNLLAAFWSNNPFMGKNLGQKPRYAAFLENLGSGSLLTRMGHCHICGNSPVVSQDFDRCWIPLAGGNDSDPCTFPGLRGKVLCTDCVSAVVVLPLGCRCCSDGPYFFHLTDDELQVEAAFEGVSALNAAFAANTEDGIRNNTALRGRPALLEITSGSILWDHSQSGHVKRVPRTGATIISFSNGKAACLNQLHLPAQALEFFGTITEAGERATFLGWAQEIQRFSDKTKRKSMLEGLCDDFEKRRSLGPLLFVLVRGRKNSRLLKGECKVLAIYEDVALGKKERFDALQRIAGRVRQMPGRYSESFVKRLGNLGSKSTILVLLRDFCKRTGTGLSITESELRAIHDSPASETASLLYLLCVAESEGENK